VQKRKADAEDEEASKRCKHCQMMAAEFEEDFFLETGMAI